MRRYRDHLEGQLLYVRYEAARLREEVTSWGAKSVHPWGFSINQNFDPHSAAQQTYITLTGPKVTIRQKLRGEDSALWEVEAEEAVVTFRARDELVDYVIDELLSVDPLTDVIEHETLTSTLAACNRAGFWTQRAVEHAALHTPLTQVLADRAAQEKRVALALESDQRLYEDLEAIERPLLIKLVTGAQPVSRGELVWAIYLVYSAIASFLAAIVWERLSEGLNPLLHAVVALTFAMVWLSIRDLPARYRKTKEFFSGCCGRPQPSVTELSRSWRGAKGELA